MADAERCCRRCEYWLPGTLAHVATADQGECLNRFSQIDMPPADHLCPYFSEDMRTDEYERPRPGVV